MSLKKILNEALNKVQDMLTAPNTVEPELKGRKDHYFIYPRDLRGNYTGHTICVLVRDNTIFHGSALCGENDHFSKKEGRKFALARALFSYTKYLERMKGSNS